MTNWTRLKTTTRTKKTDLVAALTEALALPTIVASTSGDDGTSFRDIPRLDAALRTFSDAQAKKRSASSKVIRAAYEDLADLVEERAMIDADATDHDAIERAAIDADAEVVNRERELDEGSEEIVSMHAEPAVAASPELLDAIEHDAKLDADEAATHEAIMADSADLEAQIDAEEEALATKRAAPAVAWEDESDEDAAEIEAARSKQVAAPVDDVDKFLASFKPAAKKATAKRAKNPLLIDADVVCMGKDNAGRAHKIVVHVGGQATWNGVRYSSVRAACKASDVGCSHKNGRVSVSPFSALKIEGGANLDSLRERPATSGGSTAGLSPIEKIERAIERKTALVAKHQEDLLALELDLHELKQPKNPLATAIA